MAKRAGPPPYLLFQKREEELFSPKDGKTRRVARFLRPFTQDAAKAVSLPNTPLLSEIFRDHLQQWPSTVNFKGWNMPQKRWEEWIERLAGNYSSIWNQAGIYEAIMTSRYEVPCTKDIVLGLSEFWSSETNTFVFPWGEATITLEDLMVLGGYSILGRAVTKPVIALLLKEKVEEMDKKRLDMFRNTEANEVCHSNWLEHFMEQKGYDHEHVAFLSLWLSRFVFPSLSEETIGKHVFPIAAFLSQGTRVALAPAVLAGLYRDLTLLKQQTLSCMEEISVSGPFQLLQLWALERFQPLLQTASNALKPGEPRAARWHKISSRISLPLVRSVVKLAENFQWQPYAADLSNWRLSSYYNENRPRGGVDYSHPDLRSYVKCLSASELVGLELFKEKYLPQRVAMQFGMDQDLPGEFLGLDSTSVANVRFIVPPGSYEPCVTVRYLHWWNESMLMRGATMKDTIMVAMKKIKEKCDASTAEKSLQMHKASAQVLSPPSAAAAPCPMQVKKKSSPDDSNDDDDDIPPKRMRGLEKMPVLVYVQNLKKQKLATPIERHASDFVQKLNHVENVKNKGTWTMEHELRLGAEVSEKGNTKELKKAMADGPLKNPMEVDDHSKKLGKEACLEEIEKRSLKNSIVPDEHTESTSTNKIPKVLNPE